MPAEGLMKATARVLCSAVSLPLLLVYPNNSRGKMGTKLCACRLMGPERSTLLQVHLWLYIVVVLHIDLQTPSLAVRDNQPVLFGIKGDPSGIAETPFRF